MRMTSYQGLSPWRTWRMRAGEVRTGDEPGLPRSMATPPRRMFSSASVSGDLDEVSFFHARGGLGEAVGELAIVGDNEKALAHVIEASDGVEALLHLVEELHHRGAALGILDRGNKAAGLVEDEVAVALGTLEQLAVHADVVAGGVGLGAQHSDHLAVDLNAALLDHGLGAAAAGDSGGSKDFLEAFQFGRGTRRGSELGLGGGLSFRLRG